MTKQNPTIELVDMLVAKHKLDRVKIIDHIMKNGDKNRSFKLFLSGLIYELSVNHNNLKTKLS